MRLGLLLTKTNSRVSFRQKLGHAQGTKWYEALSSIGLISSKLGLEASRAIEEATTSSVTFRLEQVSGKKSTF